ncbi:hypothetical protein [Natronincola ferrireducens]|uniref:Uncharacterized protein n=1 Tax=Natronincola ferrireducens TaxID=393762 RepID=A0A1G8XF72_9FIRM|nr:hypothetical protein [Natronincola ferrireducens]SDJ89222.1 hypothetical protein SAMN05660472_00202 [Natronincola ferrireducens]
MKKIIKETSLALLFIGIVFTFILNFQVVQTLTEEEAATIAFYRQQIVEINSLKEKNLSIEGDGPIEDHYQMEENPSIEE